MDQNTAIRIVLRFEDDFEIRVVLRLQRLPPPPVVTEGRHV